METVYRVGRSSGFLMALVLVACESNTGPSDDIVPPGTILFSSNRTGDFEIFSMKADGSDVTQVTNVPGPDLIAEASPDGSKIVVESSRVGSSKLYVMNAGGVEAVNISGANVDQHPSWSPDGRLVFSRSGRVWVADPNGTNATQGIGIPSAEYPDWSSEGATIAFAWDNAVHPGNYEIWVGSFFSQRRLTTDPAVDYAPRISPDGTKIVFHSNRSLGLSASAAEVSRTLPDRQASGGPEFDIFIMDTDDGDQGTLTVPAFHPADDLFPDWSPDGEWIVFASNRTGDSEIFVVRADGTELRNISNSPGTDTRPRWGP